MPNSVTNHVSGILPKEGDGVHNDFNLAPNIKFRRSKRANIDAFPTDAKLLETAIQQLAKLAKAHGVALRQSYVRLARKAVMMAGRYAHAKQFKRMNKKIKFLRSRLGRPMHSLAEGRPRCEDTHRNFFSSFYSFL